ncbi:PREDICTED: trypsin-1-like [Dufourea novaeangliae]|nr:PREDICTED: trypsin-1-like [Dufourea novaeangliae]
MIVTVTSTDKGKNKQNRIMLARFAIATAFLVSLIVHADTQDPLVLEEDVEWTNFGLTGRIVNGTKAALRQFPYQVSIRRSYNSRHFCGGSLINEYYILTAGHCMFLNGGLIQPWTIMVVAGELQLNQQASTGQRRGVENIYVHPEFKLNTLQNDVALLELKVPFKLTQEINVAPLAIRSPTPNSICQVAGWGYPANDFPVPTNDLMYVDLPIVDIKECRRLLVNVTSMLPGMYCSGYYEGQRDACQGDSGGGMICKGVLTGIVSGGSGCALPSVPGVYSDVFFFEKWILANMKAPVSSLLTPKDSGAKQVSAVTSVLLLTLLRGLL